MDKEYVLSLSYGKDSIACLEAIKILGYPLDRIVHAEVWATDAISADLPPMVEFKAKADKIIKERYGIEVEHICAMKDGRRMTYERGFYHIPQPRKNTQKIGGGCAEGSLQGNKTGATRFSNEPRWKGFPERTAPWCQNLKIYAKGDAPRPKKNTVRYLGIAADEPERIERHKDKAVLPLVDIGWDEAYCRKWCEENDLLSPIYTEATRGGCWFCHNQGVDQLRLLRKNYPELWKILLKWDNDSPWTFKQDGHTVHDYDRRFEQEERGWCPTDRRFKWKMLDVDEPLLQCYEESKER